MEKKEGEIIQGENAVLNKGSICHYNSEQLPTSLNLPPVGNVFLARMFERRCAE